MRRSALTGLALAALAAPLLLAPGSARADDAGTWTVGGRLGFGHAVTSRPEDDPGKPTLLYGSGFTGPGWRFGGTAAWQAHSFVRLRAGLEIARYRTSGYARAGEARRELVFGLTALELPIGVEGGYRVGVVEPFVGLGFGPRIGLSARVDDERDGFETDEPAPAIRVGTSVVGYLTLGARVDAGPVVVPLAMRMTSNLSYPNNTWERLEGWQSIEQPGDYLVDNDFTFFFTIGVDAVVGARDDD